MESPAAAVSTPLERAHRVKAAARAEGFDLVGIAEATPFPEAALDHWLDLGWDAGLWYVRESRSQRLDVREILPGARSVVAVAASYLQPDPPPPAGAAPHGLVARYARGRDYHNILRRPLRRLARFIDGIEGLGGRSYVSCDTRPVMEKAWAQRAGLGWIGKNGCLIAPPFGSYVLLGCVITTVALTADEPRADRCGTCEACLGACPTGAIPEPRYVDSNRCLAYHTIEHRDPIPPAIARNLGGRLFGCDACQEACPWNRDASAESGRLASHFRPRSEQALVPLRALLASDDAAIEERIHGTPLARAGADGLRRTARALLGAEEST